MIQYEGKMYDISNLRSVFQTFIKNKSINRKDTNINTAGYSEVQDKPPGDHTPLA